MVDTEDYDTWIPTEAPPFSFENRIHDVMLPKSVESGINGRPDLIVLSSLFWDENLLNWVSLSHTTNLDGCVSDNVSWKPDIERKMLRLWLLLLRLDTP
jgi:hypothetical protein